MSRVTSKDDIETAKKEKTAENINWAWKLNNSKIYDIKKSTPLQEYIQMQNTKWVAHIVRATNDTLMKRLMFVDEKFTKQGNHHRTVLENVIAAEEERGRSLETFLRNCKSRNSGLS